METLTQTKNCLECSKGFVKYSSDSKKYWSTKRFCSTTCSNRFNKEVGHQKLRGQKRPASVVEKCMATAFKKGQKPWNAGKPHEKVRGENHPNWKGGVTPINKIIRGSLEYKLWREAVFVRDNYTCQFCGVRGGDVHADHIKRFADFPELRLAIDNGRTLCVSCHRQTDTYGRNSTQK